MRIIAADPVETEAILRGLGLCPVCADRHEPDAPHGRTTYYSASFLLEHGRLPTREDASAHCPPPRDRARLMLANPASPIPALPPYVPNYTLPDDYAEQVLRHLYPAPGVLPVGTDLTVCRTASPSARRASALVPRDFVVPRPEPRPAGEERWLSVREEWLRSRCEETHWGDVVLGTVGGAGFGALFLVLLAMASWGMALVCTVVVVLALLCSAK